MTHRPDVLVIDDTVANLRLLRSVLGRAGYRVRVALTAEFGLAAARSDRPDLILLDLGLPDRDGMELCRELKGDPELLDIPVLVLSAATQVQRKVQAFQAGAADYVTKPFSPEEVLARIETHLRVRRYQLELESANERLDASLVHLSQLQAQRDRLVNLLAHDLRSPLMATRFALTGLPPLPDEVQEAVDIAMAATLQATDMINDLLHLRRNEGGFQADLGETSLARLVHDAVWLARPSAPGLGIEVRIDPACPSTLVCDRNLLARVLSNLLLHALRHASERVTVAVEPRLEGLHVAVSDDGPSIPEEEREQVFDLYYSGTHRGRGVSLAFCRMAVEAHGGSIEACREVLGPAICFTLPQPVERAEAGGG